MGVSRDYRVPMPIIVCGCQESMDIRKYRAVDFDYICVRAEICNGFVAEVSGKYERVAGSSTDPCSRGRRLGLIGRGQIGESRAGPGGILREVPSRMSVIAGKSERNGLLRGGVAHNQRSIAVLEEGRR